MKTYIEQETRLMSVAELISVAGGKQERNLGLFPEVFNFEAFLNTLTDSKRKVIEAAVELYKRSQVNSEIQKITSSVDIYNILADKIADLNHEEFWLVTLNQSCKVLSRRRISSGGIDQVSVDIRQVMKYAICDNATQIVIAHNHPGGRVLPSNPDKVLTMNIKKAAETLNIRLTDHLIIGGEGYYSFKDQGLI